MSTGNSNGKSDGDRDGKGGNYTTFLYIRDQVGDNGQGRPLPSSTVFWESPDVWTQGSKGINQPVVGEPTQVFTRISNSGLSTAYGVTVKYWWANPSITITEVTANLIATDSVTVPAGQIVQFQSPSDWTPMEQNGGHECLVVEAYIPFLEPLNDPMQPLYDRHVGQKNEQLVTVLPGMQFHFLLDAYNFSHEEQEVAVEIRPASIPRNFIQRFPSRVLATTEILDAPGPLPVTLGIATKPFRTVLQKKGHEERVLRSNRSHVLDCLGPAQVTHSRRFHPGEIRQVEVTGILPGTAKPGEVYVVRITQRIGTLVTGGYTLYVTSAR